MLHWNPTSQRNNCPFYNKNDNHAQFILEATCIHCLNYGFVACHSGLHPGIENRIKQLTYHEEFAKLIDEEEKS